VIVRKGIDTIERKRNVHFIECIAYKVSDDEASKSDKDVSDATGLQLYMGSGGKKDMLFPARKTFLLE
jgi:hypothetical protein